MVVQQFCNTSQSQRHEDIQSIHCCTQTQYLLTTNTSCSLAEHTCKGHNNVKKQSVLPEALSMSGQCVLIQRLRSLKFHLPMQQPKVRRKERNREGRGKKEEEKLHISCIFNVVFTGFERGEKKYITTQRNNSTLWKFIPYHFFFPQKRAFQNCFPLHFQSSTLTKKVGGQKRRNLS